MGQDPDEIRREIEETRSRMGDTVDAIGYKTDVKQRAGDYVSGKKEAIAGTARSVTSKVSGTVPDTQSVRQGGQRAVGIAQENPLGLFVGAAAAGFIAGLLTPSTRVEDERIGTVADELKERVRETGQEAFERGKDVARDTAQTAAETAKERGREQGQELSSS